MFLPHRLLLMALPLIPTFCLLGQLTAGWLWHRAEVTFKVAAYQHGNSRDVTVVAEIVSPGCWNNSSAKVKPTHPADFY